MSLVPSKFINSLSDINPGSNICFNVKYVPGCYIFEYIGKTKGIPKHIDQCKNFITSIF